MPRMSKQRRLEWSFFLDHRNRISYNPFAVGASTAASRVSGQSLFFARITGQNAGNRQTEGCHDSLYPISREGGDIPSLST